MEITAKVIKLTDTNALLDFELENRQWFEQFIPPRLNSFYSLTGVRAHIEDFLTHYQDGLMLPMLMWTPDGEICGRINLNIEESDPHCATLGYRVGKAFTRQGVATQAIELIQQHVQIGSNVTTLKAIALNSNKGSSKALLKCGFQVSSSIKDFVLLNGRHENACEYIWKAK